MTLSRHPTTLVFLLALAGPAWTQPLDPTVGADIGIQQRLDEQVPLDLTFRDETGSPVRLRDYFGERPVVLSLVYYECPMLCTQVLNGLLRSLRVLSLDLGRDFGVVTVSIDPQETPELAAVKKQEYVGRYDRSDAEGGWHFLTGEQDQIERLAEAVGFRYEYDEETDLYIHASGIMVLTPGGKLARYFYGIEYSPKDLRLGLVEASENRIGTAVDQVLLLCYHYDPATGKYGLVIMNSLRLAGAATVALLAFLVIGWVRRDRRRSAGAPTGTEPSPIEMAKDFQLHPDLASTFAWQVDSLYFLLVALSVLFAVGVFFVLVLFAIKYRRRSEDERPRPVHGSVPLELAWSIIPLFMAIGVFTLGAEIYFRMYRSPVDAIDIYVVGKQWMWKIQHPDGKREINELHIPVGQPVRLTLTSEDVIHAFSIPAFRTKRDVVPGRYNTMWFEATKTGEYHLFCAEYCGTQHSTMTGTVYVMEPEDYQEWLSGGVGGETMAQAGARQFQQLGCSTCHKSESVGRGPSLVGIYGESVQLASGETIVVDDDYLRESILTPAAKVVNGYQAIMPTFQGQISEETLIQLITYVKSLSPSE